MKIIIVLYLLSVWGLTHILVSGKIFENFRNWCHIKIPFIGKMLDCYQCTGFWASIFLYFLFGDFVPIIRNEFEFLKYIFEPFIWGLIGSGVTSYLSILFSLIIKLTKQEK